MPWTPDDAERHTHKATTWALKELWAKVANECLERTGDEGRAIREANAVVALWGLGGSYWSQLDTGLPSITVVPVGDFVRTALVSSKPAAR